MYQWLQARFLKQKRTARQRQVEAAKNTTVLSEMTSGAERSTAGHRTGRTLRRLFLALLPARSFPFPPTGKEEESKTKHLCQHSRGFGELAKKCNLALSSAGF